MFTNINTDGRRLAKRVVTVILAASCILSLCACGRAASGSMNVITDQDKIHKQIVKMLDFDIGAEYIEEAEMTKSKSVDTYGKVKILVKEGEEDNLTKLLQEHLGSGMDQEVSHLPGYQGHQYAEELKKMSDIRYYVTFKEGTVAKSIDINLYVAKDSDSTYLYIFG
ncbi:MAG: hypothetical protein IKZ29_08065 [Clostridiales bacterium]|nr:hypothetical protein [Clostridiales bacterium]